MDNKKLFISILAALLISVIEASISILILCFVILLVGITFSYSKDTRKHCYNRYVFFTLYPIYLIIAYTISFCFDETHYFGLSDPCKYIGNINISPNIDWGISAVKLVECYYMLADNNALFNVCIDVLGHWGMNERGCVSSAYLTLLITTFGLWSSIFIFKILCKFMELKDASKYTIIFCLLSPYLLYSSVIVRDMVICFLYLVGFNILLSRFKIINIIWLVVLFFIIWGIRLYSGLFFLTFIFFYIYKRIKEAQYKYVLIPIFILFGLFLISKSNVVFDKSVEELEVYQEKTEERAAGGLSSGFQALPPGVKQVVMVCFSQILPFPPYYVLKDAHSIPEFLFGFICFVYGVWWTSVFFTLMIIIFFKKGYCHLRYEELGLFILSIVFLILNTAQIDIRRMLPVYPLLFLCYIMVQKNLKPKTIKNIRKAIYISYVFLIFMYNIMRL